MYLHKLGLSKVYGSNDPLSLAVAQLTDYVNSFCTEDVNRIDDISRSYLGLLIPQRLFVQLKTVQSK